jgi:dTDP-4-amino-4,6-dideoxy-D-galactose acyltransferase
VTPVDDHEQICSYLDWDSQFFQCRIARLNRRRLDRASLSHVLEWCKTYQIDCLYFLADSDDVQTSRLAEGNNFLLTDVRMTFERPLTDSEFAASQVGIVRPALQEDIPTLRVIARSGHRETRFYFDGHFDRAKCDHLYEAWVENSFNGFASALLVAEVGGRPVGYVSCHLPTAQEAQIGIIGVAEGQQGTGIGTQLVRHFLAWATREGACRATVVTQGRNVRAQRLYQRRGFVTVSFQLWYHRWFS